MLAVTIRDYTVGDDQPVKVAEDTNLWTAPDLRSDVVARPRQAGVFSGTDLLGARHVTLHAFTDESTMTDAFDRMRDVAGAWQPSDTDLELSWVDDEGSWLLFGRPQLADPDVTFAADGVIDVECRFLATDPRIYDADESSASTGLVVAGSGLTFNAVPNFSFGGATSGGQVSAPNDGNVPAPWVATIAGPVTDPRIQLLDTGEQIALVGVIASGDVLVIDSKARSILLNGTASRYSLLQAGSRWFDLAPGPNTVTFGATAGSGTLSMSWRSAWL